MVILLSNTPFRLSKRGFLSLKTVVLYFCFHRIFFSLLWNNCKQKTKTCILRPKHYKQTNHFYLCKKICFIFSTEKYKKSDLKAWSFLTISVFKHSMQGLKRKGIFSYIRIWTRIGSQFFILLLILESKRAILNRC